MRKLIFILGIILLVLFLVFWLAPRFLSASEVGNLTINAIKEKYTPTEDIILEGKAPKNTDMIVFFAGQLSLIQSNQQGYWSYNLGKADPGKYGFQVIARVSPYKDLVESRQVVVANNRFSLSQKVTDYFKAALLFFSHK